jgi:hypothetical protein
MGPWVAAARHFAYYNRRILQPSAKSPDPDAVDRIAMLHPQRKQPYRLQWAAFGLQKNLGAVTY